MMPPRAANRSMSPTVRMFLACAARRIAGRRSLAEEETNSIRQLFSESRLLTLWTTIGLPMAVLFSSTDRASPKGSSPITAITKGAPASREEASLQVTNFVKLYRNAALTSYSFVGGASLSAGRGRTAPKRSTRAMTSRRAACRCRLFIPCLTVRTCTRP